MPTNKGERHLVMHHLLSWLRCDLTLDTKTLSVYDLVPGTGVPKARVVALWLDHPSLSRENSSSNFLAAVLKLVQFRSLLTQLYE